MKKTYELDEKDIKAAISHYLNASVTTDKIEEVDLQLVDGTDLDSGRSKKFVIAIVKAEPLKII